MVLPGCHQGMADLMIGHHPFLLIGQDGVFLLIAGDHHLNAFFQIRLIDNGASSPHGAQCSFVDNIGQFRPAGACRHTGDGVEIHILRRLDFFRMDFQNGFPAL